MGEPWSPRLWQHKHHPVPGVYRNVGDCGLSGAEELPFTPDLKMGKASSHHPGNTRIKVCYDREGKQIHMRNLCPSNACGEVFSSTDD